MSGDEVWRCGRIDPHARHPYAGRVCPGTDPAPSPSIPDPSDERGGEVLRTSAAWCEIHAVKVHDPDGWRTPDAPSWLEPITEAEFQSRLVRSTIGPATPSAPPVAVDPEAGATITVAGKVTTLSARATAGSPHRHDLTVAVQFDGFTAEEARVAAVALYKADQVTLTGPEAGDGEGTGNDG